MSPRWRERGVQLLLLLAALIHLLPLPGLAGAQLLQQLYGLAGLDAASELLLRHRALMFGLMGGSLLLALWRPDWRVATMTLVLISDLGFLGLAWMAGPLNAQLERVVWCDLASIVLLLACLSHQARTRGFPISPTS